MSVPSLSSSDNHWQVVDNGKSKSDVVEERNYFAHFLKAKESYKYAVAVSFSTTGVKASQHKVIGVAFKAFETESTGKEKTSHRNSRYVNGGLHLAHRNRQRFTSLIERRKLAFHWAESPNIGQNFSQRELPFWLASF